MSPEDGLYRPDSPRRLLVDDDDAPTTIHPVQTERKPAHAHESAWDRPFSKALALTALGTFLPGLGVLHTRWRKWGLLLLAVFLLGTLSVGTWVANDPFEAAKIGTRPRLLTFLTVLLSVGALLWAVIVVGTHLIVRPKTLTPLQRMVGAIAVAVLTFLVTTPLAVAARYSWDQAALVRRIFGENDKKRSMTRPELDTNQKSDAFWRAKPRLNLLLVGLDDSKARNYSKDAAASTDTMMVASIDTLDGDMVLIQIPRNMAGAPFPADSELAKAYPDGYTTGDADSPNSLANSIWSNVPADHPELFEHSDFKGADALKLAMQGTLGLKIDYFMALNLDGLYGLINAMGGVRINVNERIALGANNDGKPPRGWIEKGPNQLLNGDEALWYARSRYQTNDFDRMGRQSCVVKAIIDQADPQTLLTRYEAIARASGDAVTTDIPSDVLPHLVDLSQRLRNGKLDRILFVHGQHGFNTAHPNFDMMRTRVIDAIEAQGGSVPGFSRPPSTPAPSRTATPTPTPTPSASASATKKPSKPVENLKDVCAWQG